jgi:hypothetical protein
LFAGADEEGEIVRDAERDGFGRLPVVGGVSAA